MATVFNQIEGLAHWYAAVQNRDNAPAKVCVIGDSISEGVGSGGWSLRWQQLLQDRLRAAYPTSITTPGAGYIPALTAFAPGPPVTTSGGPATGFVDHGLGLKRYKVNNTQYVEWTAQQCDRVYVHYSKDTATGGAIVAIDTVDTGVQINSNAAAADGFVWDSGALTPGSHTVRVRGNAAFGAIITAAEFFNGDLSQGIRVYDSAHYGFTSASFIVAGADTGHWQVMATVQPQLIVYALGVNDWVVARTPSAFLANVDTALAKIATALGSTPYSVLLCSEYRPGLNGLSASDWAAYNAGLAARATDNVAYMNWQDDWPALVADGSTNAGLMNESTNPTHPNTAGHDRLANMMLEALTLPTVTVLLDDGSGTFPYDVTSKTFMSPGFTFNRGREDEQGAVTAGGLSLEFNNADGRFTPGSTIIDSPSPIKVDQRIRIKETLDGTTHNRFTGYVKSWRVGWPATVATHSVTQVAAADAQERAGDRRPLKSVIEEEVDPDSPTAAYTLGEPAGAQSAADTSGNQAPALTMAGTGTDVVFGTATGPGTDGLTAATFAGGKYLTTTLGATPGAVECWFATSTNDATVRPILSDLTVSPTSSKPFLQNGHLWTGGTDLGAVADGLEHHLVWNGTAMVLDNVSTGGATAPGHATISVGGSATEASFIGSIAHVATYSGTLSGARLTAHYTAGTTGFAGESGTDRLTRLAGYANIPVGTLDTSLTNVTFKDFTGQSAWDAIQDVADAEMGLVFIDGSGNLTFHNRNRVAAKTVPDLTITTDHVAFDPTNTTDDVSIVNRFETTATATGVAQVVLDATSIDSHGQSSESAEYLVSTDAEALGRANWLVSTHKEPGPRYGALVINLYKMPIADAQATVAAIEPNCWLRVTGMPSQNAGGTTADVIVQGFTEEQSATGWTLTCNVADKATLYPTPWLLGDATWSVLDSTTRLYV